ncbi:methyltransferase domain-containing protein [Salicibibacter cibi]|uniref:Methyltransferase domain-containing protein n=1 Tax=Salicibibacter cibi TaxID=2743001 RepID=A0A7T7CEU5_9BACI|nr:methyltransferase domain-containing protein [Salicibibacter cibi]QQK79457.1 methyltransferase domain-containing protein [Salicibibacter cibi]
MTKSLRIKRAELISKCQFVFKCPYCDVAMEVTTDLKSIVCSNNHSFDFAKQGYVNLLRCSPKANYGKELFEARRTMIAESDLFHPLHEFIRDIIKGAIEQLQRDVSILDVGCGEGSHLHKTIHGTKNSGVSHGFGLDISKEAIKMASRYYENHIWLVGDLANPPFHDQTFNIILNILSPSNYKAIKKILVKEGLAVKVVPRTNYLKELREFFAESEEHDYKNNETVSLFKEHFHSVKTFPLSYKKSLHPSEIQSLVQMTPLAWTFDQEKIGKFMSKESVNITVDLDILIGKNI